MDSYLKSNLLSVIIPAYNESEIIYTTASTVKKILNDANIHNEIIFINDGSKDDTWNKIKYVSKIENNIRGISFSRNFGKESAIFAGLSQAKGDCCAVIDCDLQHPPIKLVEMYKLWSNGFEVIEAIKENRVQESFLHSLCARYFYKLMGYATHIDMQNSSDFKLIDRKVVNVLLSMNEKHPFFRALSFWVGFKTTQIQFEVQDRTVGTSKWSTFSLIKYAINNVASFSTVPMQIITILGCITFFISTVLGTITLIQKMIGYSYNGFTTVILLQLFIGSINMISLGIIGYYIARIYEESKNRPRYIIAEEC